MSQPTTLPTNWFSPHASLAAISAQLSTRGIFDTLGQGVQIAQKTVKARPQDKLIDILMTLLCGAKSLVQINTLLRYDPAIPPQRGARALQRTIRGPANAGCGYRRKCAGDAAGPQDPLPPAQPGGRSHLARQVVDPGRGSHWHIVR